MGLKPESGVELHLVAVQTVVVVQTHMERVADCPGDRKQQLVVLPAEQAVEEDAQVAAGELPQLEHGEHYQETGPDW